MSLTRFHEDLNPVEPGAFVGQNNSRHQSLIQQHLVECSPQLVSDVIMSTRVQSIHVHTSLKKLNFNIFNFFSLAIFFFLENCQNPVVHRQSAQYRLLRVKTIGCVATLRKKTDLMNILDGKHMILNVWVNSSDICKRKRIINSYKP